MGIRVLLSRALELVFRRRRHLTMSMRTSAPAVPTDAAIDSRRVLTAVVTLPRETYPSPDHRIEFHRRLDERLRANPNVSAMSAASVLPLHGGAEERLDVEGRPLTDGEPLRLSGPS